MTDAEAESGAEFFLKASRMLQWLNRQYEEQLYSLEIQRMVDWAEDDEP